MYRRGALAAAFAVIDPEPPVFTPLPEAFMRYRSPGPGDQAATDTTEAAFAYNESVAPASLPKARRCRLGDRADHACADEGSEEGSPAGPQA